MEEVDREVKEQLKPKVPEKRVPVDPQIASKVYKCLNNPPAPIKLPSDFDRTLIKAHQRNKKCGKTGHQLGSQQMELELLLVPRVPAQHEVEFLAGIGLMLEQTTERTEDIPIAPVVVVPYEQ